MHIRLIDFFIIIILSRPTTVAFSILDLSAFTAIIGQSATIDMPIKLQNSFCNSSLGCLESLYCNGSTGAVRLAIKLLPEPCSASLSAQEKKIFSRTCQTQLPDMVIKPAAG